MNAATLRLTHFDASGHRHRCILRNVHSVDAAIRFAESRWGEAFSLRLIWLRGV